MAGRIRNFKTLQQQRGVSLSGLIVVLALVGVVAVTGLKVLPSVLEYNAIKNAIAAAKEAGGTVREIQSSFNKNAEVNDITAIKGSDLVISNDSGETEIGFAYEKQIPLFGNVSLLIDYAGTTDKDGVPPEKNDQGATALEGGAK
jgi:type II secretory pathway pseudopilin PulG